MGLGMLRMRRAVEAETGQALVLAAVVLMVLATAVLATAHLGQRIALRVELQNAVDAEAYSAAVLVARSLNHAAWTNRAAVAHYVSMMAAQSIAASLTGLEAATGMAADFLESAGHAAASPLRRSARSFGDAVDRIDRGIAEAVAALEADQVRLFDEQVRLREATRSALVALGELKGPLAPIPLETCRSCALRVTPERRTFAAMNAASYARLFEPGSERLGPQPWRPRQEFPDYDDAGRAAERLMAEIANGSRSGIRTAWESGHTVDGPGGYRIFGTSKLVDPMSPEFFTEAKAVGRRGRNDVFMNYWRHSQFSRGAALVSAEYVAQREEKKAAQGRVVGIQAAAFAGESFHCRYQQGAIRCDGEGFRHRFHGIAPHLSFAVMDDRAAFNQPDLYAFGHVPLREQKKVLPAKVGRDREGVGLNALARAQVYYHRPGAWSEPPNLFNPFWRARLADASATRSTWKTAFGPRWSGPLEVLRALP